MEIESVAVLISCSPLHISVSFSTVAIAGAIALEAGSDFCPALADQEEEGEGGGEGGHAVGHAGEDWEGRTTEVTQDIEDKGV